MHMTLFVGVRDGLFSAQVSEYGPSQKSDSGSGNIQPLHYEHVTHRLTSKIAYKFRIGKS